MSFELVEGQPVTVIQRAAIALNKEETEAELSALAEESKPIVSVTDPVSREVCHEAMMKLKNMRLLVQKRAKKGREEAQEYSKAVIAIERDLVALIAPEEDRLLGLRDAFDAAREAERQAKIAAEEKRVADILKRIDELRGCQTLTPASGSRLISEHIADLEAIPVDDSFAEFQARAEDAKLAGISRLNALLSAAITHEAEQQRLQEERAELARLRAESAERERLAREAQAKADAEAKAERDRLEAIARAEREAEAAAQAEANRRERERIAAEEAEAKRLRDIEHAKQVEAARAHAEEIRRQREALEAEAAENRRKDAERAAELALQQAEQRKANEAAAAALAAERAELERQKEAAKPKQKPRGASKCPNPNDMVRVLAEHYEKDAATVIGWLSLHNWKEQVAA